MYINEDCDLGFQVERAVAYERINKDVVDTRSQHPAEQQIEYETGEIT